MKLRVKRIHEFTLKKTNNITLFCNIDNSSFQLSNDKT